MIKKVKEVKYNKHPNIKENTSYKRRIQPTKLKKNNIYNETD